MLTLTLLLAAVVPCDAQANAKKCGPGGCYACKTPGDNPGGCCCGPLCPNPKPTNYRGACEAADRGSLAVCFWGCKPQPVAGAVIAHMPDHTPVGPAPAVAVLGTVGGVRVGYWLPATATDDEITAKLERLRADKDRAALPPVVIQPPQVFEFRTPTVGGT